MCKDKANQLQTERKCFSDFFFFLAKGSRLSWVQMYIIKYYCNARLPNVDDDNADSNNKRIYSKRANKPTYETVCT